MFSSLKVDCLDLLELFKLQYLSDLLKITYYLNNTFLLLGPSPMCNFSFTLVVFQKRIADLAFHLKLSFAKQTNNIIKSSAVIGDMFAKKDGISQNFQDD